MACGVHHAGTQPFLKPKTGRSLHLMLSRLMDFAKAFLHAFHSGSLVDR